MNIKIFPFVSGLIAFILVALVIVTGFTVPKSGKESARRNEVSSVKERGQKKLSPETSTTLQQVQIPPIIQGTAHITK